tara:strand:- start:4703 stop:6247 length:1545 start_codon:yes stop_codon:yes gene_type:complete
MLHAKINLTNFFKNTGILPNSLKGHTHLRTVLLCTSLLIGIQSTRSMSQELGLWIPSYEVNQTQLISNGSDSSFSLLHDLGIELLILPFEIFSENKTISSLSDQWDGNIVIDYGIKFLDAYNLEMQRDSLLNHYTSSMMLLRQQSTITGHLMHHYSPFQDSLFRERWRLVTQILKDFNTNGFYYVIPENLDSIALSFTTDNMSTRWVPKNNIFESPFQLEDLKRLESAFLINQAAEFIWFTQTWLDEAFLAHPSLEESLVFWNETGNFMLTKPAQKMSSMNTHWSRPFMVVLILLFLGLYQQSQVYRRTPMRYLTNYSFLIDDMLRYSERYTSIGFLLFVIRSCVVSLCFVIWGLSNWNDLDWVYLEHLIFGQTKHSPNTFLLWGVLSLVLLLTQLVELLLLRIPKSGYQSMRQILAIYSWNVHLNLILLLFIFIAFVNQFSIINGMTILFLIILSWCIGFVISSIQGAKINYRTGKRYVIWSLGTYILLISLSIYLFSQSEVSHGIMSMLYAL